MTRVAYISTVSVLYSVTLLALYVIAGAWAGQPVYKSIPIAVGLSVFLAWGVTERASQIAMSNQNDFTVPSIVHGCIIAVLLGLAIYARLSGKEL